MSEVEDIMTIPSTLMTNDQCEYRMSSFYSLLCSYARIKKSMNYHFDTRAIEPTSSIKPISSEDYWNFSLECEVVLSMPKDLVVLSQNKKIFSTAFGLDDRNTTCESLKFDVTQVIALECWEKASRAGIK